MFILTEIGPPAWSSTPLRLWRSPRSKAPGSRSPCRRLPLRRTCKEGASGTTHGLPRAHVEPAVVLRAPDDAPLEVAFRQMRLGVGAQPVRHYKLVFSQSIKSVCIALVVNAPHFAHGEGTHGAEVRPVSSRGAV